jgi:hypothetical protein
VRPATSTLIRTLICSTSGCSNRRSPARDLSDGAGCHNPTHPRTGRRPNKGRCAQRHIYHTRRSRECRGCQPSLCSKGAQETPRSICPPLKRGQKRGFGESRRSVLPSRVRRAVSVGNRRDSRILECALGYQSTAGPGSILIRTTAVATRRTLRDR